MNLFFVIDGKLLTPPLGDTVLDGVTRDSVISLCESLGINLEIRKISVKEIISSIEEGSLTEAFGTGTAATIAPIKMIGYKSKKYKIPEVHNSLALKILNKLNDIKYGLGEDIFNWVHKLK